MEEKFFLQICVELDKIEKLDLEKREEKEQTDLFSSFQQCENSGKTILSKSQNIHQRFEKLVSQSKTLLVPDEKNWKQWSSNDSKRFDF